MSVVTVARDMSSLPEANPSGPLPAHLEDIVGDSHQASVIIEVSKSTTPSVCSPTFLPKNASFSCGAVSVVTVARDMSSLPEANPSGPLPAHLEDIVGDSHPSLGAEGRAALTDKLYKYRHVPRHLPNR